MPRYLSIDGWFGHVGFEIQTVAAGLASLISSNAWRIAPVPPGVATAAARSAKPGPKINCTIAALNAGSPASPV